jgi:hypothetical protein
MNVIDEIRTLAYDLYLQSGSLEGRDWENWLAAETIVLRHSQPEHPEAVESKQAEMAGVEA